MKDLFKDKGTVSLNLGYGYLSPYELNNLKEGDVIKTANLAGNPFDVTFNNEFICKAEVVIMEDSFGFRVSGLKKDELKPEQPGEIDNALEVLPFTIKLDQIELSLDEIKSVREGSIVGLEKDYSLPPIVELYVMNIHVASGEFVVIDETFGIKLTKISKQSVFDAPLRSSGYKLDVALNEYKITGYDFKRPDKFSRAQIMNFKAVQQIFLSNLNLNVPETKEYEVISVDQLAFHESYEMLQKDFSFIIAATSDRRDEKHAHPIQKDAENTLIVIQMKDSKYPKRPDKIQKWFESWQDDPNKKYEKAAIICVNKGSVLSKITDEKSMAELIVNPMNNAWKNIGGINFKYSRHETDLGKAKIVPDNDMILMAIVGKKGDPNSNCCIIYPYIAIEPVIPLLNQ